MKISTRLMVLVGTLTVLLMVLGIWGLVSIEQSNASLKTVYEDRTIPAVDLGQIDALTFASRMHVAEALANPVPDVIAASTAAVESGQAEIAQKWKAYAATDLKPEAAALAKTFEADLKVFQNDGLTPAVTALRANDITEAQSAMIAKMTPLSASVKKDIDALKQLQINVAKSEFDAAVGRYNTFRILSILAIVGGLIFAGGFGVVMTSTITGQLGGEPGEANRLARSVGHGDLTTTIPVRAGDEASLMAQLQFMQSSLVRVVGEVRQASETVANASSEIAMGNSHLSDRTEQQAAALEQTAASMDELGATVQTNATRASEANQLAQQASRVAVRGGEVVGQVVDTMRDINARSHRIVDIIGVIDGIAFQTNILALNAAVEAARAGDQGRGFAVVASEVRSLAGRSAEAAKEIKSLIGASVESVERGSALVDAAGSTMTEVVASIGRVNEIMGLITAASDEQSAGVRQVGEAVALMDQATQQNAALVEEMAAAASGLKSQASELVQSVAVFKLAETGGAFRTGSAPQTAQRAESTPRSLTSSAPRKAVGAAKAPPRLPAKTSAIAAKPLQKFQALAVAKAPAVAPDDEWETF